MRDTLPPQPYNPHYDPLIDASPGKGLAYAPSYWCATAGPTPDHDGTLDSDKQVEVAIIGAGFTGLATAMFLAQEHNIKAVVLEANQVAWGCTSRNGGQGHLAWGRLSRSQWIKRWGSDTAKRLHRNSLEGFEIFRALVHNPMIDCEPCGHGNLLIAHSTHALKKLVRESEICNQVFAYQTAILQPTEVREKFLDDKECRGAMLEPVGIAVHPLKLAYGYMHIARTHGAEVHPSSPVVEWTQQGQYHFLRTPGGTVRANSVVIATAGYTSSQLHSLTAYRNMP